MKFSRVMDNSTRVSIVCSRTHS